MDRRHLLKLAVASPIAAVIEVPVASAAECGRCDDGGWVCENHETLAWDGTSASFFACGCGAGMPCPDCNELSITMPKAYPLGGKLICTEA